MKKFFAIFTAVILMPGSQLMAWDGGPFSNNSVLPGGDDGIYEAMATMTNGVGLYRFAVRNNGSSASTVAPGTATSESSNVQFGGGILAAQSSNVWYYKGISYVGVAFGMANSTMGIVSCVAYATSNTQGLQQGGGVAPVNATAVGVNGIVNPGPSGGNVRYANSNFIARMDDKGPAFRFSGKGQISFVGNVDDIAVVEAVNPVAITNSTAAAGAIFAPNVAVGTNQAIPGNQVSTTNTLVRNQNGNILPVLGITQNTSAQTEIQRTNTGSFGSQTRISTGGEDSTFDQKGHVRKFVVFGSKVSHVVTP